MQPETSGNGESELVSSQQNLGVPMPATPTQATPPVTNPPIAGPPISTVPGPGGFPPPLPSALPLAASDADGIENEWVNAAKKTIEENKHDPYVENKAMTLLRADYLNKRFNKAIKIPEN